MTASEFAFLALGLVLGVASGAALIEVLRARPPASREVRVTVAPNAIHARLASTLADPNGVGDAVGPARGGPGDRRSRDEIVATGEPAATGRSAALNESSGLVRSGPVGRTGTPVLAEQPGSAAGPAAAGSGAGSMAGLVAVPMSMEPDPITTALRASASASAVLAMAKGGPDGGTATATADRGRELSPGSTAAEGRSIETSAGPGAAPPPLPPPADAGASAAAANSAGASAEPTAPTTADGPCAEERRVAEERCAVATRAREGAVAAAETLRRTQRSYDEIAARAEAAAATADPRSVRTAKEQAQQRFRDARSSAGTHDDVETGARAWLAEINRINHDTREATLGLERDRAAAAALGPTLERLSVEADAARISAERAEEACIAAREAVVACDEARALEVAAARARPADDESASEAPGGPAVVQPPIPVRPTRIAAAMPEPEDEFEFSTAMNSHDGQESLIQRILRGDREAMQRAVARLAGDDADARRRWQGLLGGLVEALIARSIEASAFDFPIDHPFWGAFNQAQSRDIAAALSSLGFRFDGFGDWVEEHQPSQRDLSIAVGYAGLDPMRIRPWPTEAETHELLRDVRVAADEYIAGAAGGLTLGELLTLLGPRADGLAELWNDWGTVRPILLEPS